MKTEAEIRDELAGVERQLAAAKGRMAIVQLYQRRKTLQWVLGEVGE